MNQPIKDFSRPRPRLLFTIDGEQFEAAPAIPGEVLAEFAGRFADIRDDITPSEQFRVFSDVLALVLLPDPYDRFTARLRDRERPIDMTQASDVITWLLEAYGLRPTQPSSDSSAGSPNPAPGTSSTDAALPGALTPSPFPQTVS